MKKNKSSKNTFKSVLSKNWFTFMLSLLCSLAIVITVTYVSIG